MVWHSPGDLQYWFLNVFAGDITIFLAIAFIFIAAMTAMFRMPTIITGLMFALFVIMLSVYTGSLAILVLVVLGLIIGWSLTRLLK